MIDIDHRPVETGEIRIASPPDGAFAPPIYACCNDRYRSI
jgi:hypothetical protein